MTYPSAGLTARARAYLDSRTATPDQPADPPLDLVAHLLTAVDLLSARNAALTASLDQARIDPVSGLPGRPLFMARAHALADHPGAAVVMFDLNLFKPVNDRYGHDAGNAVLAALGQRINQWLLPGEVACRLGGDEFAIAVVDTGNTLLARLRDLAARIAAPVRHNGAILQVTATIGSVYLADHPDLSTAMRLADLAMLRRKGRGRRGRTADVPASREQARLRLLHRRAAGARSASGRAALNTV